MNTATNLDLSPYALEQAERELAFQDRSQPWRPSVLEARYLDWLRWCRDQGFGFPRPYEVRKALGMTSDGVERALRRMEASDLIVRQRCERNSYQVIALVFGERSNGDRPAFLRHAGRPASGDAGGRRAAP